MYMYLRAVDTYCSGLPQSLVPIDGKAASLHFPMKALEAWVASDSRLEFALSPHYFDIPAGLGRRQEPHNLRPNLPALGAGKSCSVRVQDGSGVFEASRRLASSRFPNGFPFGLL